MKNRYSVILGNLGNTCDRFLPTGYKDVPPKPEMIRQAAAIPGIEGIELVGTWDITEQNAREIHSHLADTGLVCVSIIPDLFSQKRWGLGSLSAKSADTRRQALEECRAVSRIAQQIGCPLINLWLGQDGYDYPLTADYRTQRAHLAENIHAIASEYPEIRYALEYKPKEPRNFSFHARAADTLLMANETGLENVGVCIDVGHAFMAGENVAESAVLLQHYGGKLFHMHFNDNYRSWDDDMIVGSVHCVEYLELLHWLREINYTGWYSMDQYPYREDGPAAVRESVAFLRDLEALLTDARRVALRQLIAAGDATATTRYLRELFVGGSR
ncbi:sugar phosphate isomerase/epimerase family protein [Geminisphaera colitermitum]|uniref:sugar phosphate isomerase/epimerase family protein n=1 Tax=Geminisphaera colitermitum TaxID=1148786 RepID=UPI000158CCFC|nr:sugar phosphate isomerase/epimerase family protein [Geminisphaera colitermitum]